MALNPDLDLVLQRDVDISAADIWRGWTDRDILMQWFCPLPWKVVECTIDLRPGGVFRTAMQSPEGVTMPANDGCYLLVEPERRLVWTNALGPGFRPQPAPADPHLGFQFVVDLQLQPLAASSTRYTATVMHADKAGCEKHAAMGFEQGWGIALDQLVALVVSGLPPAQ
ncbi:MAG: SRPBCC family protein [Rhodocyclaceae bacterium]|jgi:uncharacterized protein YndB with AHSA1/START domain|nr:SRPBCC family protein [Rhodocyclaceae bacterium]